MSALGYCDTCEKTVDIDTDQHYKIYIETVITLSEEDKDLYIKEQVGRWSYDNKEESKLLEKEGHARFVDEVGITSVLISKEKDV